MTLPKMSLERWALAVSMAVALSSLLTAGLGFVYTRAQMVERANVSNEMSRLRDERQEVELQRVREDLSRVQDSDARQDEVLRNLCASRARDDLETGRTPDPYLCNVEFNGRNGG